MPKADMSAPDFFAAESGEIGHWVAAPMKDVGTFEQFHEVVARAEAVVKCLRDYAADLPNRQQAEIEVLLDEKAELRRKLEFDMVLALVAAEWKVAALRAQARALGTVGLS